jgi:diguanylate cyclase (GGDEF)-like protein
MTSLKKHIDEYERATASVALNACFTALACLGQNLDRAFPGLKTGIRPKLGEISQRLRIDASPATIETSRNRFESEIGKWADAVISDLQRRTGEIKEMMLTLAGTAERITQRDTRNASRFTEFTVRVHSIARLEDIGAMRQQLNASALDLKASIQRMEEEGRATVAELQTQIDAYRLKASESERLAFTDELTGLRNRRGVEVSLESRRERRSRFAIILLDLNGFKTINDTHGHLVGDEALKHFASELREQFGPTDVVGRWGGDEFVVITDAEPGEIVASVNRVRRWVLGKYKVKTVRGVVEITLDAAIGVANWDLDEDSSSLLSRADTLMYAEKRIKA